MSLLGLHFLDRLAGPKKTAKKLDPAAVVAEFINLNPPSTLVFVQRTELGEVTEESLGRAFFLKRDKKPYSDGKCVYLTTPEGIKASRDKSVCARGEIVTLQFLHERVPRKVECKVLGRYRLLPEIVETLDFKTQAAYKLFPVSRIRKEDKRHFLRYPVKSYGGSRTAISSYVGFDLYLKSTNKVFVEHGAPPIELRQLRTAPQPEQAPADSFVALEVVEQFRELMTAKHAEDRDVFLTKIVRKADRYRRAQVEEVLLGHVKALGLEMDMVRAVIYTKKPEKSDAARDNPYNLRPGDKVLLSFWAGAYYQIPCEVLESRTQNEVLRPTGFIQPESGLKVELAEYSVGGIQLESSPELLRLLLGAGYDEQAEDPELLMGEQGQQLLEEVKRPMVHMTFYPKLLFSEKIRHFQPELPFKIPVVGQIVRSHLGGGADGKTLLHGVRFAYDPETPSLADDPEATWQMIRGMRDNVYFNEIHSKLSQLHGYLENQGREGAGKTSAGRRRGGMIAPA